MTRQEEIREVLARADYESLGHKPSRWDEITDTERNVFYCRVDKYHLPALHSKGVVIKVDREIEECCDCCEYNEWDDEGRCKVSGKYDEDRCWMWSCKAGYVATEPLIKEERQRSKRGIISR